MDQMFEGTVSGAGDFTNLPVNTVESIRRLAQLRGLASREEAEFLFTLDRAGQICGRDWFAVAAKAIVDFLVWDTRPTGHVMETDVDWLIGMVGDQPTAFGRAVMFAVVQEAESVPPRLSELVMRAAVGRCLLV